MAGLIPPKSHFPSIPAVGEPGDDLVEDEVLESGAECVGTRFDPKPARENIRHPDIEEIEFRARDGFAPYGFAKGFEQPADQRVR